MNINDRVRAIRSTLKMNQTNFGLRIDASQNYLSSIEKGHREVTEKIIKLISFEYNVNEEWLRTGEGEMFVQSETFSFDEQIKKSNLTPLEVSIMKGYMELSLETREEIVSMLEGLLQERQESAADLAEEPKKVGAEEEMDIDAEVESYRKELEDAKKIQTSSASHTRGETS